MRDDPPLFFVRPMGARDFEALSQCAFASHAGMTSLPKNKEQLAKKHDWTVKSFHKEVSSPSKELYLFVLQNFETGEIAGISGILASMGCDRPAIFYAIEEETESDPFKHQPPTQKLLKKASIEQGPSELCSLYILAPFRSQGLGTLLSLGRCLFISSHRERFQKTLMAELRGFEDEEGKSPFWEGLGRKFFDVPFHTSEIKRAENDHFIDKMLPKHPIYISLLESKVQESISRPHLHTIPAEKMLTRQNFIHSSYIDVFDGGPVLEASIENIPAITNTEKRTVKGFTERPQGSPCLIARKSPFRCIEERAEIDEKGGITLSNRASQLLDVSLGDHLYVYPLLAKEIKA